MSVPRDEISIGLSALADGELNRADSEDLLSPIEHDAGLRDELCDIHRLKDMVKYAYADASPPADSSRPARRRYLATAAAVTFLAIGFMGGRYLAPVSEANGFGVENVQHQPNKIVMFIGYADEAKLQRTLNQAEALLKQYERLDGEVNIVASAGGIDLLRKDVNPFLQRVQNLSNTYKALQLVACNNTLSQMAAQGKHIGLVDKAIAQPSAVQFVVERLRQGWRYIEI